MSDSGSVPAVFSGTNLCQIVRGDELWRFFNRLKVKSFYTFRRREKMLEKKSLNVSDVKCDSHLSQEIILLQRSVFPNL